MSNPDRDAAQRLLYPSAAELIERERDRENASLSAYEMEPTMTDPTYFRAFERTQSVSAANDAVRNTLTPAERLRLAEEDRLGGLAIVAHRKAQAEQAQEEEAVRLAAKARQDEIAGELLKAMARNGEQ